MSAHPTPRPEHDGFCAVPPHPDLLDRMLQTLEAAKESAGPFVGPMLRLSEPGPVGFNDGLIYPGAQLPLGTGAAEARAVALERTPLRGTVRVIVVLVDFSDRRITQDAQHYRDLFFSTGLLPHGSVREYYDEVSNGLVTIDGDVVGPLRMPHPSSYYAGTQSGTQVTRPNARDLAEDAVAAADGVVDFSPFDNDGDGYVDAFIVIHAGAGAEVTGLPGDIWSHKWVLPAVHPVDATRVYAYLTIPEDARIGVCCHELGHLLFGWPDFYDTDYTSAGIGNWCLMAGGSWGGDGDIPVHPSAWCKANQGWVSVVTQPSNGTLSIEDVKTGHTVHRLWRDGTGGNEYFLAENRQRIGYDESLPGSGLLIWRVDEAVADNTDERHPRLALVQADGRQDLEANRNRGDAGDVYPGSTNNTTFSSSSTPNSNSYAGAGTCVSLTNIGSAGPTMTADVTVRCALRAVPRMNGETPDVEARLAALEDKVAALAKTTSMRVG